MPAVVAAPVAELPVSVSGFPPLSRFLRSSLWIWMLKQPTKLLKID
jgi:hypothetical protein